MRTQQILSAILLFAVSAPLVAAGPGAILNYNCFGEGGIEHNGYTIIEFRTSTSPLIVPDLVEISFNETQVSYTISMPIATVYLSTEYDIGFTEALGSSQTNTVAVGPEYTHMQICYARAATPEVEVSEFRNISVVATIALLIVGLFSFRK